jgi:hypothetical protein
MQERQMSSIIAVLFSDAEIRTLHLSVLIESYKYLPDKLFLAWIMIASLSAHHTGVDDMHFHGIRHGQRSMITRLGG